MAFVCTQGTQVKSGAPAYVWLNEAAARTVLPSWMHWLIPYIDFAQGGELVDVADICSQHPEPETSFPLTDFVEGVADRSPFALATLSEKLYTYYVAKLWGTYCECASVTTTCPSWGSASLGNVFGSTNRTLMGPTSWPAGATGLTITIRNNSQNCGGGVRYWFPGTAQSATVYSQPNDTQTTYNLTKGAGATTWLIEGNGNNANTACWWQIQLISITYTGTCTSGGETYTAPADWTQPAAMPTAPTIACSTTADLCSEIANLRTRIGILQDDLTLIQRQAVPFAYIPAATASISGSGEIAVQGILAVSVDFTAIPATKGQRGTTVKDWFDLGYLALGTADGWIERHILRHDPYFIPSVPGFVTRVGYDLPAGVTATLKTWKREF